MMSVLLLSGIRNDGALPAAFFSVFSINSFLGRCLQMQQSHMYLHVMFVKKVDSKDKCVIAVLHNLCETYTYSKEIAALPSRDLVESLVDRPALSV